MPPFLPKPHGPCRHGENGQEVVTDHGDVVRATSAARVGRARPEDVVALGYRWTRAAEVRVGCEIFQVTYNVRHVEVGDTCGIVRLGARGGCAGRITEDVSSSPAAGGEEGEGVAVLGAGDVEGER